jgi:exosortase
VKVWGSSRYLAFTVAFVAIALANWDALRSIVRLSRDDMTASHLPLIPLVSVALIYNSRLTTFSACKTDYRFGLVVMLFGLMMDVTAHLAWSSLVANALSVAMAGVVMLWIGAFILIFGRQSGSRALFPLLFLWFSVPAPPVLLTVITSFLKSGSATIVEWIFTLAGTPHYREGFVFALPSVTIEIADECSGIRSSIGLLLTSLLAGHLYLRSTWQKTILALAILPIVVVKNGIRIATLCLLAIHADPGFLNGRLHHEGGFVFYLVGLAILLPILGLLHRWNAVPLLQADWRPASQP